MLNFIEWSRSNPKLKCSLTRYVFIIKKRRRYVSIYSSTEAKSIALMTAITYVATQLGISKLEQKAP